MTYRCADVDVTVTATGTDQHLDLQAQVQPHTAVVLEFGLPARLRFDPEQLVRLVCPADGNQSVGTAFRGSFFKPQDEDTPSGWNIKRLARRAIDSCTAGRWCIAPTRIRPCPCESPSRAKLARSASRLAIGRATATVNRPPQAGQADLVVIDSEHGPYFSASHLGGKGYLVADRRRRARRRDADRAGYRHRDHRPAGRNGACRREPKSGWWT